MAQKTHNLKMSRFKQMIGSNLRLLRRVSGFTGEQFAKEIGISRNHLFNVENAKAYGVVYDTLHYISKKVDMNKFFTEDLALDLIKAPTTQDIEDIKNDN